MNLPPRIIRAFLPKEAIEMLNKLKGSRTLILLVIANLPGAVEALTNVLNGVGQADLATNIAKGVAGILSIFTVIARLIPVDAPAPKAE